jgi:hypothetical protein
MPTLVVSMSVNTNRAGKWPHRQRLEHSHDKRGHGTGLLRSVQVTRQESQQLVNYHR